MFSFDVLLFFRRALNFPLFLVCLVNFFLLQCIYCGVQT